MIPRMADIGEGTVLAGYRLERQLGRGGMGSVWLATQGTLDRRVALKLLAPEISADPKFRARFLSESRLVASIDHPNIVPVFEAGEADGDLFLAMRYVEGTDLDSLINAESGLAPGRVALLLPGIADALDAAHARGLVTAVFGLVGAVVTAVVAAVTSKCPELLPSLSAVGTAAIGDCWAYLRTKEKASQSVVMGVLAAGFAAGLGQITLVCGDQFITTLPSVATAGVWVGLMAWLKTRRKRKWTRIFFAN